MRYELDAVLHGDPAATPLRFGTIEEAEAYVMSTPGMVLRVVAVTNEGEAAAARERARRMAEIDLRQLNSINWETSDMLAAAGVSSHRFKQWSLRGINYSDNPSPGHGSRRTFPLYAAYIYAGIAFLCDEAGLYVKEAATLMDTALFATAFTKAKSYKESRKIYSDTHRWPAHMTGRDMKNPSLVLSSNAQGARYVWLLAGGKPILGETGALRVISCPKGPYRPKAAAVLNLTDLLCSVDRTLAARLVDFNASQDREPAAIIT